jgi:Peptidase family M13
MQKKIDESISPLPPIPIFSRFLTLIFEDYPDVRFDQATEKVLTSKSDMLYLTTLTQILANATSAHIELFLWWNVVENFILHTTNDMRKLYYEYAVQMTTVEGGTTRSIYCSNGVNQMLGMAVSYSIVDKDFLNNTRPKVEIMLQNIRSSFNRLVRDTTWMDWETKQKTLEKSTNMKSLIGFPEWLMNKTKLENYYDGVGFFLLLFISCFILRKYAFIWQTFIFSQTPLCSRWRGRLLLFTYRLWESIDLSAQK